jgi:hypothetical protein
MRTLAYWLGIVGAPLVALAYLSAAYALVPLACLSQHHGILEAAAAMAAAATLVALGGAWLARQRLPAARGTPLGERHAFLAGVALSVSGLSLVAVVAIAATRLALGPCVQ